MTTPIHSKEVVHSALGEAWDVYLHPFEPTDDIDLVWAVSAPGTIRTAAQFDNDPGNPYNGESFNIGIVEKAVAVVQRVTALRLGKKDAEVTKDDIRKHGPKLLYNGESPTAKGARFPEQNSDFLAYCEEENFPIPLENIIIGEIDEAHTPAQVKQLADYLQNGEQNHGDKIAVVCGVPHLVRTGRYLERHKDLFPEGTVFVTAAVVQGNGEKMSRLTALEIRKALAYLAVGHLAPNSAFFPDGSPEDVRPRVKLGERASGQTGY